MLAQLVHNVWGLSQRACGRWVVLINLFATVIARLPAGLASDRAGQGPKIVYSHNTHARIRST